MRAIFVILVFMFSLSGLAAPEVGGENKPVAHPDKSAKGKQPTTNLETSSLEKNIREVAKEASEKPDAHGNEKLEIDRNIRDYTGQLAKYTDNLATFTLLLVFATFVVAAIGIWQGIQLSKSVKLSRDEFIASHRPKLIVRSVAIEFKGDDPATENAEPTKLIYTVANIGATPGTILRRNATVYTVFPGLVMPGSPRSLARSPPYNIYANMTDNSNIGSGEHYDFTNENTLSREDWQALDFLGYVTYIIGFVTYQDANKRQFFTAFCREYHPATGRCVAIDDLDYEYQD